MFFPCQEDSTDCHYKDNRCYSDKQPLKYVKPDSDNGGFRVAIIPTQIRDYSILLRLQKLLL